MKIVLTGKFNADKNVDELLEEVFHDYIIKLEKDQPESAKVLTENCEQILFTEISATYAFKMKNQEEPMVITVDPHGEGVTELLVVNAPVSDTGLLLKDELSDNDEHSLYSEEQAVLAMGLPKKFSEIESQFKSLKPIKTIEVNDEWAVKIMQQAGWGYCDESHAIVQYFNQDKLVQEVKVDLDETHTLQDVIDQYSSK